MKTKRWGCELANAEHIYAIHTEKEITKDFLEKIHLKLVHAKTEDPEEFFQKTRICIVAEKKIFLKILHALKEFDANLQGKICKIFAYRFFLFTKFSIQEKCTRNLVHFCKTLLNFYVK